MTERIPIWLDCDPGHDDATAILLALNSPSLELLGLSTVHGNSSLESTTVNAARLLIAFGTPAQFSTVPIFRGVSKPLLRPTKHDPEIHGPDGLGGVEGLPDSDDVQVRSKVEQNSQTAVEGIVEAVRSQISKQQLLTIVATGPLTNIALFISLYPELLKKGVKEIVLMGGAEGRGNRSPTAEFNIMVDPEAAKIVCDAEAKVVMLPLNVTHQAIFTPLLSRALVKPSTSSAFSSGASSQLRHTLYTLLTFFATTYASTFAFTSGPPLHDVLTLVYLTHPHLFKGKRFHVDIELTGEHTAGTTVVDLWNYKNIPLLTNETVGEGREGWSGEGRNVWLVEELEVDGFWKVFLEVVELAEQNLLVSST